MRAWPKRWLGALAALAASTAAVTVLGPNGVTSRGAELTGREAVLHEAGRVDGLLAVIAQRDGEVLLDAYFDDTSPSDLRHLRSATKSVTALLVGIALDRGLLSSVDQTLGDVLGRTATAFGPRKAALTLRHLLTMSAGLEWDESTVEEFNRMVVSSDPVAHYLRRPIVSLPGERWTYSSGASHLLSAVLGEVTGGTAAELAASALFDPLGIRDFRWESLRDGNTNGAAGLELRPRDLLKMGELVLGSGAWNGRRVVSPEWIAEATAAQIEVGGETAYGYQWWVESDGPLTRVMALGFAGQVLVVVPELDVVIVANSRWRSRGASRRARMPEVVEFLKNHLAPFVMPELA